MDEKAKRINAEKNHLVLVVDDDPMMTKLISNYLNYRNYDSIESHNGKEALEIIAETPEIDLVILDILMPEFSGYEVSRKIREAYSLYEMPVLMLTAKNEIEDIIEGFESGANDYLAKPFDMKELLARVKTLVKLKRLTKANTILQQANEMKDSVLQMTIHDLRNPITVIQGMANLLKAELSEDSELNEYVKLMLESSGLMMNLVEELIETAKIESGKLGIKKSNFNLNKVALNVIENHRAHAERKQQKLLFNTTDELCLINSDPVRIREIIDNLISNAIKFSPKGKNIKVKISAFMNGKDNKFSRIEVEDDGPGLADEDKRHVFKKFQRLSAKPTAGESSTGLGLSIVKQLVEILDGRIWVESEYGSGAKFVAEFPANER